MKGQTRISKYITVKEINYKVLTQIQKITQKILKHIYG